MTEILPLVLQGGAVAVFLLVFLAIVRGDLRTRQEIDMCERRATRAEAEADKERARSDLMIPTVQALTTTLDRQTDQMTAVLTAVNENRKVAS